MPGFTVTGELGSSASGSTWAAVRTLDDRHLVLKIVQVPDGSDLADGSDATKTVAQASATQVMALRSRIQSAHLVHQHDAIALTDGWVALVLDDDTGGSLERLLAARGRLSAGETVTTVAPLFGALADLHAAGGVHGDLSPHRVVFAADGRPLMAGLGEAALSGWPAGSEADLAAGFMAPEVVAGALPSPASDVYSMAAIGWCCLTGAAPAPLASAALATAALSSARPPPYLSRPGHSPDQPRREIPPRLVEVLIACLSADPLARPSAAAAAVEVFDASPAEPVALDSGADPALEITRRIRAAAVSAPAAVPRSARERLRRHLLVATVAVLTAALTGVGATWLLSRSALAAGPVAARSVVQPSTSRSTDPRSGTSRQVPSTDLRKATPTPPPATPASVTPAATTAPRRSVTDVVTAANSPRVSPSGLLQALVDARALAYAARDSALLDLVYAPGASKAEVDRANIATALKNGATYIGLVFVVKDAVLLDGTATTARIRATIVTPAYATGQPDGRQVAHAQEILAPSIFALHLTPDGWRILALTAQ